MSLSRAEHLRCVARVADLNRTRREEYGPAWGLDILPGYCMTNGKACAQCADHSHHPERNSG